jgi:hypothetical protein
MNQFARPGLAVTELPSFNENDKGKVLTINSESGALGWEEGSGGGGTGGGVLVVHDVDGTLDKTYAEIKAASNKCVVVVLREDGILYLSGAYFEDGTYYASFFGYERAEDYETDSENGYPALP